MVPGSAMRTAVLIGTSAACDIQVDDKYASAWHCWITREPDGRYWLTDTASTNGTQIHRYGRLHILLRAAQRHPLAIGDVIVVGRTHLPPFNPTE